MAIAAAVLGATFKRPDMKISGIQLTDLGSSEINWLVGADVTNNWTHDIYLTKVDLEARPRGADSTSAPFTGAAVDVNLPAKQSTTFDIPMSLPLTGAGADAVIALLRDCNSGTTPIDYQMFLSVRVFGLPAIRIPHEFQGALDLPCPSNVAAIGLLEAAMGAGGQGAEVMMGELLASGQ